MVRNWADVYEEEYDSDSWDDEETEDSDSDADSVLTTTGTRMMGYRSPSSSSSNKLYVLRLRENKWYVGKTNDVQKRYQEHQNGNGSQWTSIYKPMALEKVRKIESPFDEDKMVKEYMGRYGIDNVRGGSYCQEHLPQNTISHLQREIAGANDACLTCGRQGHFANQCYARTHVDGTRLYPQG